MTEDIDPERVYGLLREESEELNQFQQDFEAHMSVFYNNTLEKNPNGIKVEGEYEIDSVSETEMIEHIETAEEALKFARARIGQLVNVLHDFEVYAREDKLVYVDDSPEWVEELLNEQMDKFSEYEAGVTEKLTHLNDEPELDYSFDIDSDFPELEITDWGWPRNRLWPEELEI